MLMQQPQKDDFHNENDEILENESSEFSQDKIDAIDYDQLIGDPINMSQVQDSTISKQDILNNTGLFSSLNMNQQMEETEKQMVKYEADIRQHISIEQQLQIYIDTLKQKIEDLEGGTKILSDVNQELQHTVDNNNQYKELLQKKDL